MSILSYIHLFNWKLNFIVAVHIIMPHHTKWILLYALKDGTLRTSLYGIVWRNVVHCHMTLKNTEKPTHATPTSTSISPIPPQCSTSPTNTHLASRCGETVESHFKASAPRPAAHTDADFKKAPDVQRGKYQTVANKSRPSVLKDGKK